jgi:Fe2+ or Zn2+ uptake regulation protein
VHGVQQLTDSFRAHGRKVTAQRQSIFRALEGDVTHPSAESVFEVARREISTISLKTVYQTLHELVDLGEIAALDVGTGSVRFDPNVDGAHHHLVCRVCGKVRDHHVRVGELGTAPGDCQGYEIDQVEVVFRGLCPDCRVAGRTPGARTTAGAVTIESEMEKGTTCPT